MNDQQLTCAVQSQLCLRTHASPDPLQMLQLQGSAVFPLLVLLIRLMRTSCRLPNALIVNLLAHEASKPNAPAAFVSCVHAAAGRLC